jgi:hypothetical protein
MRLLVGAVLLLGAQEKETRIRFALQHDTGAKDGIGARKLNPEEDRAFEKELRALPAVKEATVKASAATVVLNPGATLKFTEIKAAGKKVPTPDGGFNQVVFNTLKLEGRVTLALQVEKNREKVKDAIKGAGAVEVAEGADGWDCVFKTPEDTIGLVKAICAKCGLEYRIFEILKDITWHAPAR